MSDEGKEAPRAHDLLLGAQLRSARHARGLTIQQVASETGLTKGFLSKLERDGTAPSVASLVRVCEALGISIGSLFEPSPGSLVRAEEAPAINFGGEAISDVLLTPNTQAQLQVVKSTLEPSSTGGRALYTLASQAEFVHVLQGGIEVQVGQQVHKLGKGDSLTFSPREPHTWWNSSAKRKAVVLWVISPAA